MAKKRELKHVSIQGLGEDSKYVSEGEEVKVRCVGRGYAIKNNLETTREARFFRVVCMAEKNKIYVLDYFAPERGKNSK